MDDTKKANRANEKNQRDDLSKVRSLLSSGGSPSDNPLVEQYFKGYVFPAMTVVDNRVLSQLGNMRAKFLKDFFDPKISPAARAALIDLTIQQAREAYRNNSLHPGRTTEHGVLNWHARPNAWRAITTAISSTLQIRLRFTWRHPKICRLTGILESRGSCWNPATRRN